MRVVHHDPAYTVPDNHRLGHIAQLEPVGTVKHFILHFARGGIVVGKRGIAVLEIPLVGNEKTRGRYREIFHLSVIPFHATAENWQAEKKRQIRCIVLLIVIRIKKSTRIITGTLVKV